MITIIYGGVACGKTVSVQRFLEKYKQVPTYYHCCTKPPVLDWRETEENALIIYDEAHYLFSRQKIHASIVIDLVSQEDTERTIVLLTQSTSLIHLPILKVSKVESLDDSFLSDFNIW